MPAALGIDLGGTAIKAVLVDAAGSVERRETRPTDDFGDAAWAETIRDLADTLGAGLPVGISAPGLAAADGSHITCMPGRLAGLAGLRWAEFLQRRTPVRVLNDAHASLLGEAWTGAAAGLSEAFLLTLGTGVGGAILRGGRLWRGHTGRAGHLGHLCLDLRGPPDICGTPGSLEDLVGNHSIARRTGGRFATTHALIAAYRTGDEGARRPWLDTIHALACGVASLINVLDPEAVIIGGGIAEAGDALFGPLRDALARLEWRPHGHPVPILPATLGPWAGAVGAARTALQDS